MASLLISSSSILTSGDHSRTAAVMASFRRTADNAELFERLILETFGHLLDDFTMYSATEDHRTTVLRNQYHARLRLADLRTAPEGLVITQRMSNGTDKQLCVLTPPNMVAVREVNSTWRRTRRVKSVHGPAPHTMAFYLEAILACGLRHYFSTSAHLTMCADDPEGKHLVVAGPPPLHSTNNAESHLLLGRHASVLQYPSVHDAAPDTSRVLSARFTADQRRNLGRRFPALLLDVMDAVVVIHPRGHLTLYPAASNSAKQQPVACGPVSVSDIDWRLVDSLPASVSFYEEITSTMQIFSGLNKRFADRSREAVARAVSGPSSASRDTGRGPIARLELGSSGTRGQRVMRHRSAAVRANDVQRYIAQGMIVSPRQQVRGPGSYRWLATFGTDLAQELELDHIDVPEREYNNPPQQPDGEGRFEYLTNDDEDLAHLNFGGVQDDVLPHQHTATDVWNLRQRLRAQARSNVTQQIRLVWVPTAWVREHSARLTYMLTTARATADDPMVLDDDSHGSREEDKESAGGGKIAETSESWQSRDGDEEGERSRSVATENGFEKRRLLGATLRSRSLGN
ncbi:hypothetical protein LTR95_002640 [Oleoguttula sp. CCFEE 5521]